MQENFPSGSGFVVEWQLADDADTVIDLPAAEAQIRKPAPAEAASEATVPSPR